MHFGQSLRLNSWKSYAASSYPIATPLLPDAVRDLSYIMSSMQTKIGRYRTYLGIVIETCGRSPCIVWMDYVTVLQEQPHFDRVLDAKKHINKVRNDEENCRWFDRQQERLTQ